MVTGPEQSWESRADILTLKHWIFCSFLSLQKFYLSATVGKVGGYELDISLV